MVNKGNKMFKDITNAQLMEGIESKQKQLSEHDKDFADIVTNYVKNNFNHKEANERLQDVLDTINSLKGGSPYKYYYIIKKTGAVKELTDPNFLDILKRLGYNSERYIDAMETIKEVKELTDPKLINIEKRLSDYIPRSGYLDAMETVKDVKNLTSKEFIEAMDEKTLKLIQGFAYYKAKSFFGAIARTGEIKRIMDPKIFNIEKRLEYINKEFTDATYLDAMHTPEDVKNLTSKEFIESMDEKTLKFIQSFNYFKAKSFFGAIARTGEIKRLINPKIFNIEKKFFNIEKRLFLYHHAEMDYLDAMQTPEDVKNLTSKEFIEAMDEKILKSIGDFYYVKSKSFFGAIARTGEIKILTDKNTINLIKYLGDNARKYLDAMQTPEDVKILTSAEFMDSIDEKTLKLIHTIEYYAHCNFFNIITRTHTIKEFKDPNFVDIIINLNHYANLYLNAMKTPEDVKILTGKDFIDALNNTMDEKTIKLIKRADYNNNNTLFYEMMGIWFYSKTHKLSRNSTFLEDPIIKTIKPENANKDFNKFKSEVKGWSNAIKNFELAEEKGFGSIDKTKFDRLLKFYSRTGGSIEYISFASNFIKSKEDFEILLSGEKGRIYKMIMNGVNSYFMNYRALPKSVEGWGGIKILRFVWDNRKVLAPEFLLKVLNYDKKKLFDENTFNIINRVLPKFNSPYIKTYELHNENGINDTNNITKDEISEIVSNSLNIIKKVFPSENIDKQQVLDQIKIRFQLFKNDIGGNLNNKVENILKKSGTNENLENFDFKKAISILKDLKEIKKEINNKNQNTLDSYEKIIDPIESIITSKYYSENIINLENDLKDAEKSLKDNKEISKDKMESYIKLTDKVLDNVYQYITDDDMFIVNSRTRNDLFNNSKDKISENLQKIEKYIHTEGVLTVKSWDRSLNDLFGGRFSGDCTAPPTESDFSGIHFDANIEWLKDPGTLILNVYWKDKIEGKQKPIGRIYCFAAEMDGKPTLFIDSLEFLKSFNAGEEVKKILPKVIKNLSNDFGVPVAINTNKISNRVWVNDVMYRNAAEFDKRVVVPIKKIGNNVFMEHLSTNLIRKELYII